MGFGVTGIIQNLGGIDGGDTSDKAIYGSKPVVPGPIDYGPTLQRAVQSNIDLLPSLKELGLLSTDAFTEMLERALPGFGRLRDTTTGIIQDKLEGKIPKDVLRLLERNAAERGVTLGTSGSQFNEYDELRNLGLTSLAVQNEGLAQNMSWLNQNRANTFDFTKFFQGKDEAVRQTEFNWSRDWLAAQVASAPDPQARGAFDAEMGFIGQVMSVYGGGPGYQQTYRPSYGGGGDWGSGGSGYRSGPTGYDSYLGGAGGGDLPDDITHGAEY